jgi:hypothetical protein
MMGILGAAAVEVVPKSEIIEIAVKPSLWKEAVRYSIDHPDVYIESNLIGFYNILEACRHNPVEHLVYASSSSVYGGNKKVPFSTDDKVDNPVSLYAATKKSDELSGRGNNLSEKFHEWSSPYSNYSYEETEYKIQRAIAAKKPCTCKYICEKLGFNCPEGGCGVKAPVVFSLYTKEEQIHNLLNKDTLTAEDVLEEYALKLAAYAKEHCPADYSRLKLRVKKTGVGLRDFEHAVRSEIEKFTPLEFNVVPSEIVLDGIELGGAKEPTGYTLSLEDGVKSVCYEESVPVNVCLCHETVVITGRLENIDTGQEKMELSYYRNSRWKTLIAPDPRCLAKMPLFVWLTAACRFPQTMRKVSSGI